MNNSTNGGKNVKPSDIVKNKPKATTNFMTSFALVFFATLAIILIGYIAFKKNNNENSIKNNNIKKTLIVDSNGNTISVVEEGSIVILSEPKQPKQQKKTVKTKIKEENKKHINNDIVKETSIVTEKKEHKNKNEDKNKNASHVPVPTQRNNKNTENNDVIDINLDDEEQLIEKPEKIGQNEEQKQENQYEDNTEINNVIKIDMSGDDDDDNDYEIKQINTK